ncbi:Nucleobase-ascorbate transporter [Vigna angularis]|uniref:Nucleobase-ascorbate transporter n=1 Tax=Phaseolus angularis TaxID=3914 RepID=A0A8T0JZ99_PHAAN|nr:Nucleobase-ascorbate transporter [Vigna angularis]
MGDKLEARGFPPKFGLRVLEEKSLIKIRECPHETVTMHDMIRCMGKEIVRQQKPLPHKRNRMWFYEDVVYITILPASIEECHFLKILHAHDCKKLQEIRGLPLSIKDFSAANSSVEANSLTLKLRQAIDYGAMGICVLPGRKIPELFDHSSRGNSVSFWFRKELPTLAVCAIIGVWDNVKPPFVAFFSFVVGVEKNIYKCVCCFRCGNIRWTTEDSHIIILNFQNDFQHTLNTDIQTVLLTNEWIPGEILLTTHPKSDLGKSGEIRRTGVYVNRTLSRMEDVRFEDPYDLNKASTMENKLVLLGEASDTQQQAQSSALFNLTTSLESVIGEQPLNYEYNNSDSKESASTVDSNNQGVLVDDQPILAPSSAETQNAEGKREMAQLILEVSREFTAQVSMKIESTASQSPKVDEVEAGLETQNQFRTLENQIHQRLTRIKKMKEELGEKFSAIKADISAIEANNSSIKAKISDIKAIFLQTDQSQTEAYKAASHLASVTPPPVMLSRGIGWQDCDRENVELLGSNRIGNRKVIEVSASFMIFFSMLGKFGALFASIPFPMFVAIYYVLFGIVVDKRE